MLRGSWPKPVISGLGLESVGGSRRYERLLLCPIQSNFVVGFVKCSVNCQKTIDKYLMEFKQR